MDVKLHKVAPWIALGVVLCVLSLAWFRQTQSVENRARANLTDDIQKIETLLQARFKSYEDLLRTASESSSAQRPGDNSWRRFVRSLDLDQKWPGIYGFGYALYVQEKNRDSHMAIVPPGQRFDYFVVRDIEPRDHNDHLIGFDLGSELSARTAAESARDTQSAAVSGKIVLLDDTDHRTFLLFYPMRRDGAPGWVFARFREEDLLKGFLSNESTPLILQVYEGPAMTKDALFFDSGAPLTAWQKPNHEAVTVVKGFQAAGRTWTLNFTPRPGAGPILRPANLLMMLPLFGICLLVVISVFIWSWMRQRADVVAHQMLGGMKQKETALTMGPHGIVLTDATQADLPIIYANRAFEKITGYSAQEVFGKNCRFLQGTDRDQKPLPELRQAIKQQHDCRVLLRNYRKDGTPFWNDLFVSPVRNDMGRVIQMIAILQDVTEREQSSRRLSTEVAIIRSLTESPSLYEAMPRILQAICEAQEWDVGTFWRLDPRSDNLQCVDIWSPADLNSHDFESFLRETPMKRESGVPGLVWAKGEQIMLPELAKETHLPEGALAQQAGLMSACGFPIANRRGLQGALVFYSRRMWPLSKNLLLLMVGTSAQISQYMDKDQLQIEQQELTMLERGMAEFIGEGLIAMDRTGQCLYVNAVAGRMLGYHPRTLVGQKAHEILHPAGTSAACDPTYCPIVLSLQSRNAVSVDDSGSVFRRKEHEPLPVSYTTSPIIDQDLIQGVVITFVDASARRAQDDEQRRALQAKEDDIKRLRQAQAYTPDMRAQEQEWRRAMDEKTAEIQKLQARLSQAEEESASRRTKEGQILEALAEKDKEIKSLKKMILEVEESRQQPTEADQLVEKIRKMLG